MLEIAAHLTGVLVLGCLLLVPGFLAFGAYKKRQDRPRMEWFEEVFVWVAASAAVVSWAGFVLAEAGYFSLTALCLFTGIFCLVAAAVGKPGVKFPRPSRGLRTLAVLLLVALSFALFFRPFEWVVGGRDPGVYVNTGVNIARTGSIIIHSEILAEAPSDVKPLFNVDDGKNTGIPWQFLGFSVGDVSSGTIYPQFFHLYPVWVAIFYSALGMTECLTVTPFFGMLAVIAVFLAASRLFGYRAGAAGAVLLSVNFSEVWFSRYPTTEVLSQFLMFGGLYAYSLFVRHRSAFFGLLAAALWGETFLARVDMYPILLPLAIHLAWLGRREGLGRAHAIFIGALLFFLAHSVLHALAFSPAYFSLVAGLAYKVRVLGVLGGAAMAFLAAAAILVFAYWRLRISGPAARGVLVFALILLCVYGFFIAPALYPQGNQAFNLVKLGWYLGGVGVVLAVAGLSSAIYGDDPDTRLPSSVFVLFSLIYLSASQIYPDNPWWARRYVPVVIPFCLVYAGVSLSRLSRRGRFGAAAAAALFCWLIYAYGSATAPLYGYEELGGAYGSVRGIAESLSGNPVVFFMMGDSTEGGGSFLGTPLRYVFGTDSVWMTDDPQAVDETVSYFGHLAGSGHSVYVVFPSDGLGHALSKRYVLEAGRFTVNQAQLSVQPTFSKANLPFVGRALPLYSMDSFTGGMAEFERSSFLIGFDSGLGLERLGGFYGNEASGNVSFAWSGPAANISLAGVPDGEDARLDLVVLNIRPDNPDVALSAGGVALPYTVRDGGGALAYSLDVPARLARSAGRVDLSVDAWRPTQGDNRSLGLPFDSIRISFHNASASLREFVFYGLKPFNKTESRFIGFDGGAGDFYVGGVHGPENGGASSFRWTRNRSEISLAGLPLDGEIGLRMSVLKLRPGSWAEANVSFSVGGMPVPYEVTDEGMSFLVEATVPANSESVVMTANSWRPASDPRDLGVPLDWMELKAAGPDATL
jgi:hypothetical protein